MKCRITLVNDATFTFHLASRVSVVHTGRVVFVKVYQEKSLDYHKGHFTNWMLFLLPNQEYKITERKLSKIYNSVNSIITC